MRYNNLMDMITRSAGEKRYTVKLPIWGWLLFIVFLAVAWKVFWLINAAFPFNADEAITGLMARHILHGERPVFFYGQAYMGSLDAYLAAGLFQVLGDTVSSIRVLQIMLYICTIITTAWLGKKLTESWETGLVAAFLMAIPVVNVTLYTTVSLGGYGEALVLSNFAFLCAMQLQLPVSGTQRAAGKKIVVVGLLGLITGIGFWVFGLTLVATIPTAVFGIFSLWRHKDKEGWYVPLALLTFTVFFFLGSFPWWQASIKSGIGLQIKELLGSAVSIEKESWIIRSGNHLFNYVFLGLPAVFGFRPSWEVRWLVLPMLPFILIGWGMAFWQFPRLLNKTKTVNRHSWYVLIGSVGFLTAGFLFTSFGLDPSGRYFLPLAVPFSLMMAWVITSLSFRIEIKFLLVLFLVLFNAIGTGQAALKYPPGITTQFDEVTWIDHRADTELMEFLRSSGELRGYSNYWVSYPLAFQSREEIIFSPRLPYHTDLRYTNRDDRIPSYTKLVENASRTAYITTFNPALDRSLKKGFTRLGISWQEKTIGDYHVYYGLNRPVHPADLEVELREILPMRETNESD